MAKTQEAESSAVIGLLDTELVALVADFSITGPDIENFPEETVTEVDKIRSNSAEFPCVSIGDYSYFDFLRRNNEWENQRLNQFDFDSYLIDKVKQNPGYFHPYMEGPKIQDAHRALKDEGNGETIAGSHFEYSCHDIAEKMVEIVSDEDSSLEKHLKLDDLKGNTYAVLAPTSQHLEKARRAYNNGDF